MLEYVNCNLCNTNDTKLLWIINSFNIVKCKKCGLVYVNPQPDEESLKEFYSTEIFTDEHWAKFDKLERPNWFREEEGKIRYCEECLKNIENYKAKGKLLDVGCGDGVFLRVAHRAGWQVYGVEISQRFYDYLTREKLNVFQGNIEQIKFLTDYFDVVTFYAVLEHLKNPFGALVKANQIMKIGGLLGLTVPNIASYKARWEKDRWDMLAPPGHLYFFSPNTLKSLLKECGFKVLKLGTPVDIINRKIMQNIGISSEKSEKLRKIINLYLNGVKKQIRNFIGKVIGGENIIAYAVKVRRI